MYTNIDHTFLICAYKESRYLEDCIQSLINQKEKTNIIICTSTPNEFIKSLGNKYSVPVCINEEGARNGSNISKDWNFALSQCKTPLATIAHQDDVYKDTYSKEIIATFNSASKPLIAFSDYSEIKNGLEVNENKLLSIKRLLLKPLNKQKNWESKFWRRRVLSLGNPICCPAVSYCLPNLELPVFKSGFRSDLDWEAWENLSRQDGSFCYVNKILMSHRIHEESTTTEVIAGEYGRSKEDFEMYCKFWPVWFARIIEHFYKDSEKQNSK